MKNHFVIALALASAAVLAVLAGGAGAKAADDIFSVHALVSHGAATPAPAADAKLVNGWGLSAGPTTPWWAANNGSNTSTLYSGVGSKAALTVTVAGGPTGTVFNGNGADFAVSQNGQERRGPLPLRDRGRNRARLVADGERHDRARRCRSLGDRRRLQGPRVASGPSVRDGLPQRPCRRVRLQSFNPFSIIGGSRTPKLPAGFAPFGIQALDGNIFVTYAKQDAAKNDDVPGPGRGTSTSSARRRAGRAGRRTAARRTHR